MEILLDTNFLIYLVKYKIIDQLIDLHPKTLLIHKQVFDELKKLTQKGKAKDKESAKVALIFVEKWKNEKKLIILKPSVKYTDEALIDTAVSRAEKGRVFLATLDRTLIKKLKKVKIGIIKIRQKKYLMLD